MQAAGIDNGLLVIIIAAVILLLAIFIVIMAMLRKVVPPTEAHIITGNMAASKATITVNKCPECGNTKTMNLNAKTDEYCEFCSHGEEKVKMKVVTEPWGMLVYCQDPSQSPDGKVRTTYYNWPTWLPKLGILVKVIDLRIRALPIKNYNTFTAASARVVLDVTVYYRITNVLMAVQRLVSMDAFDKSIEALCLGAIRKTTSKYQPVDIIEKRQEIAEGVKMEITSDLKQWGVELTAVTVVDIKDPSDSTVIADLSAMKEAEINSLSRQTVAAKKKDAALAEAQNKKLAETANIEAEEQIAMRQQDKNRRVAEAEKIAVEQKLTVTRTQQETEADIARNVLLTNTDAAKKQLIINAEADKQRTIIEAEAAQQNTIIAAEAMKQKQIVEAEGQKQATIAKQEGEGLAQARLAEGRKLAAIAEAEGIKQANIAKQEGEGLAEAKKAEGIKQANIAQAQGRAQALILEMEAEGQSEARKAEGIKQSKIALADGEAEAVKRVADANKARFIAEGTGQGEATLSIGSAEAEIIKRKLVAEADGMRAKAEAANLYQTGALSMRNIEKDEAVGKAFAEAWKYADVKLIGNAPQNPMDLLTPSGALGAGAAFGAAMEGAKETSPTAKALFKALVKKAGLDVDEPQEEKKE